MNNQSNLQPNEIKNLTKVVNQYIASKTSSALSKLLSEPIKYNVMILEKEFFNFRNIKLAPDEIKMCAVKLYGKGDTHIEICYAIKIKYAKMIASKLLGEEETEEITELGTSAIQEVANILTGSFFNAMSLGTGYRVELSTPDYQLGNLESLAKGSAGNILKPKKSAVIADTELIGEKSGIRIHMLIMQETTNVRKLLNQIKKFKKTEFSSLDDSNLKINNLDNESSISGFNKSEIDTELEGLQENEVENK